jgi:competence protein ComGF
MNKAVRKKISASTLPEVLIAMIIIMAVFTVAITIYSRITFSGVSVTDTQAHGVMNQMVINGIEENKWEEQTLVLDSIHYQKSISPYKDFKDLFIFQVTAKREQKTIGTIRQIVKKVAIE